MGTYPVAETEYDDSPGIVHRNNRLEPTQKNSTKVNRLKNAQQRLRSFLSESGPEHAQNMEKKDTHSATPDTNATIHRTVLGSL